eukprot:GFYU01000163.1.p1 GENE.GFYU01000163.1~~GFYU01000163.1.p1  ORF type:complete len:575 (+),score=145.39 GFYU01000163.1:117-1841(+)
MAPNVPEDEPVAAVAYAVKQARAGTSGKQGDIDEDEGTHYTFSREGYGGDNNTREQFATTLRQRNGRRSNESFTQASEAHPDDGGAKSAMRAGSGVQVGAMLSTAIANVRKLPSTIVRVTRSLLLPVGYPESVCNEYVEFQCWDTVTEACGFFRGLLNHQAWLAGLGVGDPEATPMSAVCVAMTIAAVRMFTGLCSAANNSWIAAFEADQKMWAVVAELLNFVGTLLGFCVLFTPGYFFSLSLASGVIFSVAEVITGCSRAPLITHLARADNFSDCSAKEGNQSRVLRFLVILMGYNFLIFVNETHNRALLTFALLSVGRVLCHSRSVRVLQLRTLNRHRFNLVFSDWWSVQSSDATTAHTDDADDTTREGMEMSPESIAKKEVLFDPLLQYLRRRSVLRHNPAEPSTMVRESVGDSVDSCMDSLIAAAHTTTKDSSTSNIAAYDSGELMASYIELHESAPPLTTGYTVGHVIVAIPNSNQVHVILKHGVTPQQVMFAFFHLNVLHRHWSVEATTGATLRTPDYSGCVEVVRASLKAAALQWKPFSDTLARKDWKTETHLLREGPFRIHIEPQH